MLSAHEVLTSSSSIENGTFAIAHRGVPVVKRLLDILVCTPLLIILMPLFMLVAISIKADSPGPVIFRQIRMGREQKPFVMYKFRTMFRDTPELPTSAMQAGLSPITRVGRFLRATSIDELPQLLNVFSGDMSIVGPRPIITSQSKLIDLRNTKNIYSLNPGITGWAQINGRDNLTSEEIVKFDSWYRENWNIMLDLLIILKTIKVVLMREGVY